SECAPAAHGASIDTSASAIPPARAGKFTHRFKLTPAITAEWLTSVGERFQMRTTADMTRGNGDDGTETKLGIVASCTLGATGSWKRRDLEQTSTRAGGSDRRPSRPCTVGGDEEDNCRRLVVGPRRGTAHRRTGRPARERRLLVHLPRDSVAERRV